MAWIDMAVAPVEVGPTGTFAYESSEALTSAGNGSWIIIPTGIQIISIILNVFAGSGSVQVTNSPVYEVKTGSPYVLTWDDGVVTSTTQSAVLPVTAIRQVNTSGTTILELRAQ